MGASKLDTREGNSSSFFRVLKISLYERKKKDDQIRKYEKSMSNDLNHIF